jgi:predicted dehydrogenase
MALHWGVLGTARIAVNALVPALRRAERCEVVAIASRDARQASAAADALSIPRAYGDYQDLLTDPDIDAVYIPLPNHLHAAWTMAAARAGKHVLCEKPLGMSSAEARSMAAASEAAGIVLMEAFMYRLHPTWLAVRELLSSGRIGELQTIRGWFSAFNDDPDDFRNVLEFGGGALMDLGCYCVNLSRMLFGAEPESVHSSVFRDPASGVDILTSALLGFPAGTCTFTVSTRLEPHQQVEVFGSGGRVVIEIPFNIPADRDTRVFLYRGGTPPIAPPTETMVFPPVDQYTLEAETFTRAVLDGEPLPFTPADSIANMEVIERIFAAA